MKNRKIAAVLLALILLLCSCGTRPAETEGKTTAPETSAEITTKAAPERTASAPVQSTEEENASRVLSDVTIELHSLSRCELPAEGTLSVYEEPFICGTEKETDKLRQGDTAYISAVREICLREKGGSEYREQAFRVVYVRDGKTVTGWVMHDLLPEPVFELKEGAKYYCYIEQSKGGRKWTENTYHHAADEQGSQSPWSVILYSEVEGMWKLTGSGGSEIYVEDLSVLEETERPDPALDPSPEPAS